VLVDVEVDVELDEEAELLELVLVCSTSTRWTSS